MEAWAKCPSAWARVKKEDVVADMRTGGIPKPPGLGMITWRTHRTTGTAALIVLLALAVAANLAKKGLEKKERMHTNNLVFATYTELENLTGLSRVLISRALRLLEDLQAISTLKVGNACAYALQGIEKDGDWCSVPQERLMDGTDYLKKLKGIRETIRRPASFFAMKLYILLMVFRDRRANVTRISYEVIAQYTGLRREDISLGWQTLAALQLAYLADDQEVPRRVGDGTYNRYRILGLNASS